MSLNKEKVFSKIGFTFLITIFINIFLESMIITTLNLISEDILNYEFVMLIVRSINTYLITYLIFYFKLRNLPDADKIEEKPLNYKQLIRIFLIMYTLSSLITVIVNQLFHYLEIYILNRNVNILDATGSNSNIIVSLIFFVLIGPIAEEIFFRGLLLNKLRDYGNENAIIATAVLFGLFHSTLVQFSFSIFLGVILAYITIKTGTIKYSVGLHILFNSFSIIIFPLINQFNYGQVFNNLILAIMLIGGIILIIKNRKMILEICIKEIFSKNLNFKLIFLNAGIIIYGIFKILTYI